MGTESALWYPFGAGIAGGSSNERPRHRSTAGRVEPGKTVRPGIELLLPGYGYPGRLPGRWRLKAPRARPSYESSIKKEV